MAVAITQNNTAFTLHLLNETIKAEDKSENIIVSPFSIQACLTLAFIGADGKTAEELSTGLRLGTLDKEEAASNLMKLIPRTPSTKHSLVKIANKIYVQSGLQLKPEFNEIAVTKLKSSAENIDFTKSEEAAKMINDWVEKLTNNKIQNLLNPIDVEGSSVILVNAMHFKARWEICFKEDDTKKDKFWINENEFKEVDMMYSKDSYRMKVLKDLKAKIIQLAYYHPEVYMLIIIPDKKTGLKDLEKKLEVIDLNDIEKDISYEDVELWLPKFKTEFSLQLKDVLVKMGMETMFTNGANFSHLIGERVKIDKVFHKAMIEVNEAGTEAAAASYGRSIPLCGFPTPTHYHEVRVDRPFLYFIKNKKVSYFMGRVSKF